MADKSAFPYMSTLSDGSIFCDSPGMTFREWQWTLFAAATISGVHGFSNKDYDPLSVEDVAALACEQADTMMAAIAEREQESHD